MTSSYRAFLCGRFFDGLSSGMFMMALPWLMLANGASGALVALTAFVCTAGSFLFTPILATYIDRHSRKNILIGVQCIQAVTAALVFVSFLKGNAHIGVLIFAQLVFWWTGDFAWSTNSAFTQEHFNAHEYPTVSGRLEMVMQTTSLGSGAAGILLMSIWSMREFSAFAMIASLIAALCYGLMPYRRQLSIVLKTSFIGQLVETKTIFQRQPRFFIFLALSCLSYPVLTFLSKLIPIYFSELNLTGDYFAAWKVAYGLGALICGIGVAKLLENFATEKVMFNSVLILSMLLVAMFITLNPLLLIVFTLPFGFFNSFNRIARTVKMSRELNVSERGRIDGGLKLFSTMSQSLGYVLIAWLSHIQYTNIGFLVAALTLLLAALAMQALHRQGAHISVS